MLPSPPKFKFHLLISSNYYALLDFFFLKFCKMPVDWVVGGNECYLPHLSSNLTCFLIVISMHFYIQTQTHLLRNHGWFHFLPLFWGVYFYLFLFLFFIFKDNVLFSWETQIYTKCK